MNAQDIMIALKGKCELSFEDAKRIAQQAKELGFDRLDEEVANDLASIINDVGVEKALSTPEHGEVGHD